MPIWAGAKGRRLRAAVCYRPLSCIITDSTPATTATAINAIVNPYSTTRASRPSLVNQSRIAPHQAPTSTSPQSTPRPQECSHRNLRPDGCIQLVTYGLAQPPICADIGGSLPPGLGPSCGPRSVVESSAGEFFMSDDRYQSLHRWFPFLHSWRLLEDRNTPYRECVKCGHVQMMTNGQRR